MFAPAHPGSSKGHLLWLRGETLVAQEFDASSLKLLGEPHRIAEPVAWEGVHGQMRAAASENGVLLYSPSNRLSQLVWYGRNGKPLGPLGDTGSYAHIRLSPDGRRVVFTRQNPGGNDIWTMGTDRGVATRLTSLPGINIYPVWSPDSRIIVFISGAPFNLYSKDAGGANAAQRLTESPNNQFSNDWSADGHWILFQENVDGRTTLFALPAPPGNGRATRYSRTDFNERFGRFSPDGRWVAFESDESGQFEVYVDSFPEPRGKIRISTNGGHSAQWGPGGRELFYVSADSMLMSAGMKLGPRDVEPSPLQALMRVNTVRGGGSAYAPSLDGQRFLVAEPEKTVRPLRVIANWPALLHRPSKVQ